MNTHNIIRTHFENGLMFVIWRDKCFPASIGRNGVIAASDKREGDGCTPLGQYQVIRGIVRTDRICETCVKSKLSIDHNTQDAGWCDEPTHPSYNAYVTKPFLASHEDLWRDDHVYDLVLITNHNMNPVVPYRGSAIFIHIAAEDINEHGVSILKPTDGCLSLRKDDLLTIVNECDEGLIWTIE